MSLIEINDTEPTEAEKLAKTKNTLKSIAKNLNDTIVSRHKLMWNIVWDNQYGLTPQEVLTEMGTDAGELFTYSDGVQDLLAAADQEYVMLITPNEYVLELDGTVTIGELRA